MATEIKTTTKTTCDKCGKECEKRKSICFIDGYVGQGTDQHAITATVNVSLCIPYATPNADLCKECMCSILKAAIIAVEKGE
jgi:hypothetical protein